MSYSFDGANDTLSLASAPLTGAPLTISAWIKLPASIGSDCIVSLGASSSTDNQFQLRINSNGSLSARTRTTSNGDTTDSGGNIADQNWHFVFAEFSATNNRVACIDNTSPSTADTTDLTPAGVNALRVGENNNQLEDFEGSVGHLCLWNRQLDSTDKAFLAAGGNPMSAPGGVPTRYWPLTNDAVDLIAAATFTVSGATLQTGDNPSVANSTIWPQYMRRRSTLITM